MTTRLSPALETPAGEFEYCSTCILSQHSLTHSITHSHIHTLTHSFTHTHTPLGTAMAHTTVLFITRLAGQPCLKKGMVIGLIQTWAKCGPRINCKLGI